MDDIKAALVLERLDDEVATFIGGDVARMDREIFGHTVTFEGRFPLVTFPRDAWMDMGCPVTLNITLSEYVVSDDPRNA